MAGENRAERFVAARNAEARKLIRLLLTEPFIARVKVDWGAKDRGIQTLYFPARSAGGLSKAIDGAYLVSYLEDLGRLAEYNAGDVAEIEVNGRERAGRILECSQIEPTQHEQRSAGPRMSRTRPTKDDAPALAMRGRFRFLMKLQQAPIIPKLSRLQVARGSLPV
jgi:hypothetical protein